MSDYSVFASLVAPLSTWRIKSSKQFGNYAADQENQIPENVVDCMDHNKNQYRVAQLVNGILQPH